VEKLEKKWKKDEKKAKKWEKKMNAMWITIVIHRVLGVGELWISHTLYLIT
jgi:hypothetical protein